MPNNDFIPQHTTYYFILFYAEIGEEWKVFSTIFSDSIKTKAHCLGFWKVLY